jgi:hypothetical protein
MKALEDILHESGRKRVMERSDDGQQDIVPDNNKFAFDKRGTF